MPFPTEVYRRHKKPRHVLDRAREATYADLAMFAGGELTEAEAPPVFFDEGDEDDESEHVLHDGNSLLSQQAVLDNLQRRGGRRKAKRSWLRDWDIALERLVRTPRQLLPTILTLCVLCAIYFIVYRRSLGTAVVVSASWKRVMLLEVVRDEPCLLRDWDTGKGAEEVWEQTQITVEGSGTDLPFWPLTSGNATHKVLRTYEEYSLMLLARGSLTPELFFCPAGKYSQVARMMPNCTVVLERGLLFGITKLVVPPHQ
eukprot:TRINITY_DN4446_c0_g1_i2.p1 TRINITY_DN4446_c0_g1~~TRINITY_DN4446_c0_g1_i2.p1  ORF type:complete len:283 (+),score=64.62 TRINITY_DN4446_c0_g1_i2:79-849(+)